MTPPTGAIRTPGAARRDEFVSRFLGAWRLGCDGDGMALFTEPLIVSVLPEFARVADRCLPRRPTLLDLGCGRGRVVAAFAAAGFVSVGVDDNEEVLAAAARDAYASGHAFVLCDATRLAVADNSIDGIISISASQYLDRGTMVSECQRALRAGGLVVLIENLRFNPLVLSYRLVRWAARRLPRRPGCLERIAREPAPRRHATWNELRAIGDAFVEVRTSAHYLTSPLILLGSTLLGLRPATQESWRGKAFSWCERLDSWLIKRVPLLRNLCWLVVFEGESPIEGRSRATMHRQGR